MQKTVSEELENLPYPSAVGIVSALLAEASDARASDIHIDPTAKGVKVRFRVDGVLQQKYMMPKNLHEEIISRIKILASLRTDEHQSAQDGRFRVEGDMPVDIRVCIVPTYHGENAVLRLLTDHAEQFTLESLEFSSELITAIRESLKKPHGMILVTGPTGSGKTTTLYSLLKQLSAEASCIITIEDPIEYSLDGIDQIQVNSKSHLNFSNGLRAILRQDPNIIMVGEIRDQETAAIAVNAALTGHLLLSTLHTNDAATTLPRLLDLKVEAYLIASTINIIIAQRLVRRICVNCKAPEHILDAEYERLSLLYPALPPKQQFFYGKGCDHCGGSGFMGRVGVHEILVPNEALREAVLKKSSARQLRAIAAESGMKTMLEDGFLKAGRGLTTITEVLRVLYE